MKWLLAVAVIAPGASASAQEASRGEDERAAPVRELRVLRDPYDIASFYRQGGTPPPAPRYQDEEGRITIDPRSISSFYRSDAGGDGGRRDWPYRRFRVSRKR